MNAGIKTEFCELAPTSWLRSRTTSCNFLNLPRYVVVTLNNNNMIAIISEAWDIKAEVSFSEYNHKTKKRVSVDRQLTSTHKTLIMRAIDSTDCGEFLCERVGDVELSGYFSLIQD